MTHKLETELVDRLGELRAEMKVLKDEAKDIESYLKTSGAGRYDGENYSALVTVSERKSTDWKAIATKLKASKYMIWAYSKVSDVCTLKLTAHRKEMA